jgi:hypothetical protein
MLKAVDGPCSWRRSTVSPLGDGVAAEICVAACDVVGRRPRRHRSWQLPSRRHRKAGGPTAANKFDKKKAKSATKKGLEIEDGGKKKKKAYIRQASS